MAIPKETKSAEPEASFKTILPEDIDWKPFAAFPPAVRLAVLVGQPSEPGPYMIRVKVPAGVKLMPHRHPEDRVYTVISGVFYIGLGDEFNADKLGNISARCGDRAARKYVPFPLSEIRRVCESGDGDWAAGARICGRERRSAESNSAR